MAKKLFVEMEGWLDKSTTFNADGSISESYGTDKVDTLFNSDGSITENLYRDEILISSKTTYFEGDIIREVVSDELGGS